MNNKPLQEMLIAMVCEQAASATQVFDELLAAANASRLKARVAR